jgi:hypothetical protein
MLVVLVTVQRQPAPVAMPVCIVALVADDIEARAVRALLNAVDLMVVFVLLCIAALTADDCGARAARG